MAEATRTLSPNRRTDHQLRLERKRITMVRVFAFFLNSEHSLSRKPDNRRLKSA
jgi:hypothetical protein